MGLSERSFLNRKWLTVCVGDIPNQGGLVVSRAGLDSEKVFALGLSAGIGSHGNVCRYPSSSMYTGHCNIACALRVPSMFESDACRWLSSKSIVLPSIVQKIHLESLVGESHRQRRASSGFES